MLGGLAADEGAAGLHAALGNAGDDGSHLLGDILADGDVVKEEQGLCTAADDIVDAHGNAVDTDGVMLVHQHGKAQLGAHAVGAGDQHRLGHAGHIGGEEAAETADVGHNTGNMGALDISAHKLHALVAGGNVHAGGGIGSGVGFLVHLSYSFPVQQ